MTLVETYLDKHFAIRSLSGYTALAFHINVHYPLTKATNNENYKTLDAQRSSYFLSCGDDDPMPTSSGMVGNWTVTAVDYRGTTTMSALGTNIKSDFTGTGKDMTVNTVFNENPNTVNSQGSYTIVLRTTTMGQTATEERTFDEVVTNGSWSLSGKKLTITDSHGPQEATILEQTSTALKIRVDVKESETNLGITVTTDLHVTYTFKK